MFRSSVKNRIASVVVAALLLGGSGCSLFGSTNTKGTIQFGFGIHRVSAYEIQIVKPTDTFYRGQGMAWVAYLKRAVSAHSLTLTILSDGKNGRVYVQRQVRIVNPRFTVVANPGMPVRGLEMLGLSAPGSYVLRYSRAGQTLAEGSFSIRR